MEIAVRLDGTLKLLVDTVAEMVGGVVKGGHGGIIETGGGDSVKTGGK